MIALQWMVLGGGTDVQSDEGYAAGTPTGAGPVAGVAPGVGEVAGVTFQIGSVSKQKEQKRAPRNRLRTRKNKKSQRKKQEGDDWFSLYWPSPYEKHIKSNK